MTDYYGKTKFTPMIKAIIFDCFGVIRIDAFDAAYQRYGGDVVKDHEFIMQTLYNSNSGLISSSAEVVAERLGITADEWRRAIDEGSTLNQNVLDYAMELRKKYKTAMLSNIGKGGLERMFELGLLDVYFDLAVGSGDIGYAKPDAQAYEYIADKLQVRLDECIFIDDRQEYVDGARAIGMHAILFVSYNQLKTNLSELL